MRGVRFATPEDEGQLRALLRENPMDSWVSITLEREPSYFRGASLMGASRTFLSEEDGETVGMFSCSRLPVHINGEKAAVGYLGGLRVGSRFRHRIRYIREGFRALGTMMPKDDAVPFYITSIATENTHARKLLEANLEGMPTYTPAGQLTTLIFSTAKGKKSGILQQATPEDIPLIADFYNRHAAAWQFSAHLDSSWLEGLDGTLGLRIDDFWLMRDKDGGIKGCLALWDQRGFKQSVVRGYRAPLGQLRTIYNLYALLTDRVTLPAPGERLEHLYIAFFACENSGDALTMIRKAASLAQGVKGANSCVMGLSSRHTLLPLLKKELRPSLYLTEIETVVLDGEENGMSLDGRPVQPEAALL